MARWDHVRADRIFRCELSPRYRPSVQNAVETAPEKIENPKAVILKTEVWIKLLESIGSGPVSVTIPYATVLADLFGDCGQTRVNRDFSKVLSLIGAHALLHHETRGRRSNGAIIAEIPDYKAVRALIKPYLDVALETKTPPTTQKVVDAVRDLQKTKHTVTIMDIGAKLNLHRSNVSRYVQSAIDLGLLVNLEVNDNKPKRLVANTVASRRKSVLPRTSDVARAYRDRKRLN